MDITEAGDLVERFVWPMPVAGTLDIQGNGWKAATADAWPLDPEIANELTKFASLKIGKIY